MTIRNCIDYLGALTVRCLVLAICFASNAYAQSLATSSWGSATPNVSSFPWTPTQIGAFIDSITSSVVPTNVGDFQFADLAADGNLELVAAVDYSGRGYFNSIVVVHETAVGFGVQQIEATNVLSLANSIVDIKGDGKRELLVPISLTGYTSGSFPSDAWTAVYSWSQQTLVDSTSSYSAYEKSLLPNLKSAAMSLNNSAPGSVDAVVAQAIYDKVQRVSGTDSTAGLNDASVWAVSPLREVRVVAAATLADIGTPAAQTILGPLLADSDATVAIYADSAVKQVQQTNAVPVHIDIQPSGEDKTKDKIIDIDSPAPATVRITSVAGFANPGDIELRSITFGETGTETSVIECRRFGESDRERPGKERDKDHDGPGITCLFRVSAAGFSLGDSVGILRTKLKSGRSVKGVGAITLGSDPKHRKSDD
jgi:hypothetical protein